MPRHTRTGRWEKDRRPDELTEMLKESRFGKKRAAIEDAPIPIPPIPTEADASDDMEKALARAWREDNERKKRGF